VLAQDIFTLILGFILFYIMFVLRFTPHSFNLVLFSFYEYDLLSYFIFILTGFIFILILISSDFILKFKFYFYYYFTLILINFFMLLIFFVKNILAFYVFFEASLLPVFLVVVIWGGQPEKLQSGLYIFFYTLFGSLPFILILRYFSSNTVYYFFSYKFIFKFVQRFNIILYFFILLIFLVKIPLFGLHIWLPKAHVEAPVTGSIILAGVLLKIGGYGLIRFIFLFKGYAKFLIFLESLSLLGALLIRFLCLKQIDLKILIAYSSVVHIGVVVAGLRSYFYLGYLGGIYLMVGHGLCSSCLFYSLNLFYERSHRRSFLMGKRNTRIFFAVRIWWFICCVGNIANPPRLNFFGEIILFGAVYIIRSLLFLIIILVFFLSSCYTLFLYSYTRQGRVYSFSIKYTLITVKENFIILFHLFPLNILFLI
jgi:NADH-ubiquinone oxidoreductase chain 4